MDIINIEKASTTFESQKIPDCQILIRDHITLPDESFFPNIFFDKEAAKIADAFYKHLPQGTIDSLVSLLNMRQRE